MTESKTTENDTTADIPAADVDDADAVAFIEQLNAKIDEDSSAPGFATRVIGNDGAHRHTTAIDPADPPQIQSSAMLRITDAYEAAVDDGDLAAAAALRRQNGLGAQKTLASRINEYRTLIADESGWL